MKKGARILLCPFGSEGDVNPLLWGAKALAEAGHRPHLLVTANYGHLAQASGIPWTPVGQRDDFDKAMRDSRFWHPLTGPLHVSRAMVESLPAFLEGYRRVREPPDMVLASTFGLAASFAAEAQGIPRLHLHMQPVLFRNTGSFPLMSHGMEWLQRSPKILQNIAYRAVDVFIDGVLRRPVNQFRESLGLPPLRSIFREAVMGGNANALFVPGWFANLKSEKDPVCLGFPVEKGKPLPAGVEKFLAQNPGTALWTHGSANRDTEYFWSCAVRTAQNLGCPSLLVGKEPPRFALPAACLHLTEVPFESVFAKVRVVVHHAGIGTTAKALAAGVPQLAIPRAHDQPDNAARIEALGAGLRLPYPQLNVKRCSELLGRLLGADLEVCKEIAQRPGLKASPGRFVSWVESLLN